MDWVAKHRVRILEAALIIIFSFFPLVMNFPYRINIFLSWEGAYRIAEGQIPFRDFGMPLGFAYWLIPALFFKIFGPYLFTLVKAQAFINAITISSFREVLKSMELGEYKRLIILLLFCISYVLMNFWPWYNNTVFMYQLISIVFLLKAIHSESAKKAFLFFGASSIALTLSFFTKQDGGGLAILVNLFILAYAAWQDGSIKYLAYYILVTTLFFGLFIVPFLQYDFSYWFNYGQEPHFSRLSGKDLLDFLFQGSFWIKLYLVIVAILVIQKIQNLGFQAFINDKFMMVQTLLVLGILVQASIIQVTSYVPINNNIYFHSFACAYIISNINWPFRDNIKFAAMGGLMVMIWWSGSYYKYVSRIVSRLIPVENKDTGDRVSVRNYANGQSGPTQPAEKWIEPSGLRAFKGIYLPETAIAGIQRIKQMPVFNSDKEPTVLNMSELTPLAYELDYQLETGPNIPLWYHLNVSFFDRELELYRDRITNNFYDVVIFENIPHLNNFYPFEIRDHLLLHYQKVDSFTAPRTDSNDSVIEVFVPRNSQFE